MRPKRLSLTRETLGDLGSDELSLVAGGTTRTLGSCNYIVCVTIFSCAPTCIGSVDPSCITSLQPSICICD
jgi:hypothetical protein